MGEELVLPDGEALCRFVEAYFLWQGTWDRKSRANHDIYRVPAHNRNISVPRTQPGRSIKRGTFFESILPDIGIKAADYREWAGTPAKLSAYIKTRKLG